MSNYKMTLSKKVSNNIIKSVSQSLREKGGDAAKVVPQLEDNKDKYLEILSHPFVLNKSEVERLENIYKNVPDEVIFRMVKMKASEYLHAIMTLDLNKLLVVQLDKNVTDIQEDKQLLVRTLRDLDTLSEHLDEVIKLPECLNFALWRGADLLVMHENDSLPTDEKPSMMFVKTKYPNQLSYIISQSFFISKHFIDYISKYYFCERLGNAANNYEGDTLIGMLESVIEEAKANVAQFHDNFVKNKNERVGDRRIKMFG